MAMRTQTEVHFHGIEKSDAIEARILEKVSKLEKHFDRLSRCRVVLEAPHRNGQRPLAFQIKIELTVPSKKPIIVCHEQVVSQGNEELPIVIRDAFAAATRKVEGTARKIKERGKAERGRRRPSRTNGAAEE